MSFYDERPWVKSYAPDALKHVDPPTVGFIDHWDDFIARSASCPALRYLGTTLSHKQLYDHADRMTKTLKDLGLKKGDVVGVCLPNTPQYLITVLGALKGGFAVTGVSPLLTPDEMTYQLNDSGAKVFVILDLLFEKSLAGVANQVPGLQTVITTTLLDLLPGWKQVLARALKKVPSGRITPLAGKKMMTFKTVLSQKAGVTPKTSVSLDDACFVQYTGGTTGPPKGAVLTHANLAANVTQLRAVYSFEMGQDAFCSGLPMFHIAGLVLSLLGPYFGMDQVIVPDPRNTKYIMDQVLKYRPNLFVNVPTLYLMLMAEPRFKDLDWSFARIFFYGAAPFTEDGIQSLERIVGRDKVRALYGMTETCPGIAHDHPGVPRRAGSVGLPMPGIKLRLVDAVTGVGDVPQGQEGEIVIRGPQVMKGYHNKPDENARVFVEIDGEKWMRTGDIGRMDEDGFLYIVDRSKDMIIVSGYKVFSTELEDKLSEHPAIEMCAVVGAPNPERPETEMVKLVVQKSAAYADKPEDQVRADILAFAKKKLAAYKVPKVIEFRPMPLTAVGKIDKKRLR
ncbi:MAG: AMP-binding protein [Pseudomonadota bacterium]